MSKVLGLDIGSQNIKIVELEGKAGKWKLNTYGKIANKVGSSFFETDDERKILKDSIRKLLKEAKISAKEVNICVPEPQVFTQIVETPLLSEGELNKAMQWQAEQYIPLPLDEVSFDYAIIEQNKQADKMQVLICAAPRHLIDKLVLLGTDAGLEILSVETSMLSAARAVSSLVLDELNTNTVLIDIGFRSCDFVFLEQDKILMIRSVAIGGWALTRSISQQLGLNEEQAERYKITYGIDTEQLDGKLAAAAAPILDQFLKELNKGFVFIKEQFPNKKYGLVLLCGGGALMPGFVAFMTENLGIEAQVVDPFAKLALKKKLAVPSGGSAEYTIAAGLAMRQ